LEKKAKDGIRNLRLDYMLEFSKKREHRPTIAIQETGTDSDHDEEIDSPLAQKRPVSFVLRVF
jgi:hypothetical protein